MQLELFLSIPKKERILLMQFSRILPMELFKEYANQRTVLTQYLEDFPEFRTVFVILDDMELYYSYYPHARETKTEAITSWESELKKIQKRIQPKAKKLVKWFHQLKKQGKITEEKAKPNIEGALFQRAREISQHLASLWFIETVSLFGSVAVGTEKKGSDIDLLLHHTIRAKTKVEPVLNHIKNDVKQRFNIDLDMLNHSKHMENIGFYEPAVVMAEEPAIKIFGQHPILKKDLQVFVVDLYAGHHLQLILLPKTTEDTGYSVVLISDSEQIALFSIKMEGNLGIFSSLAENRLALKKQNIPFTDADFQRFIGDLMTELLRKQEPELNHVFPESFYESYKDMPTF